MSIFARVCHRLGEVQGELSQNLPRSEFLPFRPRCMFLPFRSFALSFCALAAHMIRDFGNFDLFNQRRKVHVADYML